MEDAWKHHQYGFWIGGDCIAVPPVIINLLRWNAQGLGNPDVFLSLRKLLRNNSPNHVFLMETRFHGDKARDSPVRLGFHSGFSVDSGGRVGAYLPLKDCWDVSIRSYSRRHIDALVTYAKGRKWRFTGSVIHSRNIGSTLRIYWGIWHNCFKSLGAVLEISMPFSELEKRKEEPMFTTRVYMISVIVWKSASWGLWGLNGSLSCMTGAP